MSNDILAKIISDKRLYVEECKFAWPVAAVRSAAQDTPKRRPFITALRAAIGDGGCGLIAEIKKASPSKGLIREDFDAAELARGYASGGATCLSVLTDIPYFQGADAYLTTARETVTLPILRKDFMVDPYQVIEARAIGADCILLIMAGLTDMQAGDLFATAREWNMDVLVEVHDEEDLERALALKPEMIGVNNRNLKTLSVDLAVSERLAPIFPEHILRVCESGIYGPDDMSRMQQSGYHSFLVGESLMRQADVSMAVRSLLAPLTPGAQAVG